MIHGEHIISLPLIRTATAKTPSQVIAEELGVPVESKTTRAIRKVSSMGAEGVDYLSAFFPINFFFKLKIIRKHPAE